VPLAYLAGHLVLALAALEPDHRNLLALDETSNLRAETIPQPTEKSRRRQREAQVFAEEKHQLTRSLELRHVAVDVDPIDAAHLKTDLICENLRDGRAHGGPPLSWQKVEAPSCPTVTSPARRFEAKLR
jgi:hypothetical protein